MGSIHIDTHDGRARMSVAGNVDLACAVELRNAVQSLTATGTRMIDVDVTGVTFVEDAGFRAIQAARARAGDRGCELVVTGVSAAWLRVDQA